MKRVILYIGIALAAIGCTKDAEVDTSSGSDALTITSDIATRAEKSQWVTNDPIGVYMTSVDFGDEGGNVKYVTTSGNGAFSSDAPIYFPSTGAVEVFAYYPYDENVSITAYKIKSVDQVDLLSASKAGLTATTSSMVALTFNHLLSKVSLAISAGDGLETTDLSGLAVALSGISTEATFDLAITSSATTTNADAELELTTTTAGTSSSAIVIPQDLSAATPTLSFTTALYGTFSAKLSTKEFEVGKEYTYKVTLNRDGVEITSSNIDKWGNDGTTDGTADIVDIEYKSSDNTYYINSAKGLAAFRDIVNQGRSNSQNATYAGFDESEFTSSNTGIYGVLTRDIDLSDICGANVGSGTSWVPIGYTNNDSGSWVEYGYAGTFDGGGYEITGLYINTTLNQQALFRSVDAAGAVCNLGVSGSTTYTPDDNFNGQLGGIVAYNAGTIINCYSSVTVNGDKMCNVGGIAAYSSGSVVNCYNLNAITGLVNVGGIVGKNDGSDGYVGYCYNTGKVSPSDTTVSSVTIGTGENSEFIIKYGGIVGYNNSTHLVQVKGSFCLNNTYVSIGQLATNTSSGTLNTNVCYEEFLTSETFATTMNNGAATYNSDYSPKFTACAWIYNAGGYPLHDFNATPSKQDLDINFNSVSYSINSAKGLQAFAALVNGEAKPAGVVTSGDDRYFQFGLAHADIDGKLTVDIALDGIAWTPIGNAGSNSSLKFSGEFDGNGKSVSGLSINSDLNIQGLFGYLDADGVVNNLTVAGEVTAQSVAGTYSTAGIVASNAGLVINCCNYVNVSGDNLVGGVAGENNSAGYVFNSCNHGVIYGAGSAVGGVVGSNNAVIYSVYNSGGVSGGGSYIGSVAGYTISTATQCYTLTGATTTNYIFGNSTTIWDDYIMTAEQLQALSPTLNKNAYTYNNNNSTATQAYGWVAASGGYPAIVSGSTPNTDGTCTLP